MIISDIGMMKKQTQTFNLQCFYFLFYIIILMPSGIFKTWKFCMGVFWGFNFWSGDFMGF